jgi:hypothetical protein
MSHSFVLMLVFGIVLFAVGALTRTYMNVVIGRSPLSDGSGARSTELRYWRLIKAQGGRVWPLVVTVVFIPLGILVVFAAFIWSNQVTTGG